MVITSLYFIYLFSLSFCLRIRPDRFLPDAPGPRGALPFPFDGFIIVPDFALFMNGP